jgi:hypothetical protein
MNNKVLVKIIVPVSGNKYDIFIPVNELVWKINKLIVKAISDIEEGIIDPRNKYIFINKINNKIYESNEIIINTDIRNGTELILLKAD